ncbi:MAG: iron-sulfur cluster assembly protein [Myxococcota bacterium]|nr:iron-sulfur cluster assembly protein [Myxococcota bacterium]
MGLRDRVKRGARRAIERFSESGGTVSRPPVYRSEAESKASAEAANGASAEVQEIPEHIVTAIREPTEEVEAPEVEVAPAPVAEEEEEVFDGEPVDEETAARIHEDVIGAIKTVFDPEIPVNIYELGLIYEVAVRPGSVVTVRMTLTSPNCPAAQSLPEEVKQKSAAVEGVNEARVKVVWEPTWGPQLMSEAAQLELNLM